MVDDEAHVATGHQQGGWIGSVSGGRLGTRSSGEKTAASAAPAHTRSASTPAWKKRVAETEQTLRGRSHLRSPRQSRPLKATSPPSPTRVWRPTNHALRPVVRPTTHRRGAARQAALGDHSRRRGAPCPKTTQARRRWSSHTPTRHIATRGVVVAAEAVCRLNGSVCVCSPS